MAENKTHAFLDNLKKKAAAQESYGGFGRPIPANMDARVCPNCGAGRAKQDGLTQCAYCGYRFLDADLTDGVYIKKEDNSGHL
jgi:uncharacterized Zn finger protein (UPF0148 family)